MRVIQILREWELTRATPNVKEHATLSAGARVDHGVSVETTEDHVNRAAGRGCVSRLVCAQHGHVVNGVQVPCRNTKHENEDTTTRGQARKGDRPREGRLWENRELMDKNRIEGRHGASRGHNTPKTTGMPVEVNSAAVRRSNVPLPGEWKRSGHGGPDCLSNPPSNLTGVSP